MTSYRTNWSKTAKAAGKRSNDSRTNEMRNLIPALSLSALIALTGCVGPSVNEQIRIPLNQDEIEPCPAALEITDDWTNQDGGTNDIEGLLVAMGQANDECAEEKASVLKKVRKTNKGA